VVLESVMEGHFRAQLLKRPIILVGDWNVVFPHSRSKVRSSTAKLKRPIILVGD